MTWRSFLECEELSPLGVSLFNSFNRVQLFHKLIGCEVTTIEYLAGLSTLLFFDVIHERVPEKEHSSDSQGKVTLWCIVERVGLVPIGEHSLILMREGSMLTWLEGSLDATEKDSRSLFLTWDTCPSWGCCSRRCWYPWTSEGSWIRSMICFPEPKWLAEESNDELCFQSFLYKLQ